MYDIHYDDLRERPFSPVNHKFFDNINPKQIYRKNPNNKDRSGSRDGINYVQNPEKNFYDTLPKENYGGEWSPSNAVSDYERWALGSQPSHRPLTKQVDQMAYELPRAHRYAHPSLRCYSSPFKKRATFASKGAAGVGIAPQFLKVFGDVNDAPTGSRVILDCVLLGMPRPRVAWLFNGERVGFDDVLIDDTADLCRLTIARLAPYHYGTYTVIAENEVGRAVTNAIVSPQPRPYASHKPHFHRTQR